MQLKCNGILWEWTILPLKAGAALVSSVVVGLFNYMILLMFSSNLSPAAFWLLLSFQFNFAMVCNDDFFSHLLIIFAMHRGRPRIIRFLFCSCSCFFSMSSQKTNKCLWCFWYRDAALTWTLRLWYDQGFSTLMVCELACIHEVEGSSLGRRRKKEIIVCYRHFLFLNYYNHPVKSKLPYDSEDVFWIWIS